MTPNPPPPAPKDINGIVKELQEYQKQWLTDGKNPDSWEKAAFLDGLARHFPAIASALLDRTEELKEQCRISSKYQMLWERQEEKLKVCVEALEECSRRDDHLGIVKPIADRALSRIRSL